jgi:uncharacterized protein (TIGR03067 family)
MKTHRIWLMVGLVVLLTAPVHGGGDGKKSEKDQKALQGTWVAVKGDKKAEVEFSGAKFVVKLDDDVYKGTFTLNPSKKPKQIDMTVKDGPKYVGMVSLGIYKIEGGTLTWRTNEPGREQRPEDFTSEIEGTLLLVLGKKKND